MNAPGYIHDDARLPLFTTPTVSWICANECTVYKKKLKTLYLFLKVCNKLLSCWKILLIFVLYVIYIPINIYIKLKISEIGFFSVIIFLKTRQVLTTFELLFRMYMYNFLENYYDILIRRLYGNYQILWQAQRCSC